MGIDQRETKQIFINFSNHPSVCWDEDQRKAAEKYGEIIDLAFPNVTPSATEDEIKKIAEEQINNIIAYRPAVVMCQGEFTLTYRVVEELKKRRIRAVAACSERVVEEQVMPDGSTSKESRFKFVQFRSY